MAPSLVQKMCMLGTEGSKTSVKPSAALKGKPLWIAEDVQDLQLKVSGVPLNAKNDSLNETYSLELIQTKTMVSDKFGGSYASKFSRTISSVLNDNSTKNDVTAWYEKIFLPFVNVILLVLQVFNVSVGFESDTYCRLNFLPKKTLIKRMTPIKDTTSTDQNVMKILEFASKNYIDQDSNKYSSISKPSTDATVHVKFSLDPGTSVPSLQWNHLTAEENFRIQSFPEYKVSSWETDSRDLYTDPSYVTIPPPFEYEGLICGLCEEAVISKKFFYRRRFAVLENCDHMFCVGCIENSQDKKSGIISCPGCGTKSFIIATSSRWFEGVKKDDYMREFSAAVQFILKQQSFPVIYGISTF